MSVANVTKTSLGKKPVLQVSSPLLSKEVLGEKNNQTKPNTNKKTQTNKPLIFKNVCCTQTEHPLYFVSQTNVVTIISSAAGRWHDLGHRNYFG